MTEYYIAKTGDDTDPGTLAEPWLTIGKANTTLTAGDSVNIRTGTYAERIIPTNTGTSGNRVVYQNYQDEVVTLDYPTAASRILDLINRAYTSVYGLTLECNGTARGIRIENGDHNIIKDCTLRNTHSGSHGIDIDNAEYTILRNVTTVDHGADEGAQTDGVFITENSHYALVEDCTIGNSYHAGINVRRGSYCVIRNNTISNLWGQAAATSRGSTGECLHNVWESNTFYSPNLGLDGLRSSGIQTAANGNIFRRNIFRHCHGGGWRAWAQNEVTTRECKDNRLYNNVFYANIGAGAAFTLFAVDNGEEISGNVFINNIFYKNIYDNDTGMPYAIAFRNLFSGLGLESNLFYYNDILYLASSSDVVNHVNLGTHTLSWYETNHATEFHDNTESDPLFVNEGANDFHLLAGSPCRNAGTHLTQCSGGGTGTAITVDDASWFCDGHGIVDGDDIVIGTDKVTITDINYATQVITVDQSITWIDNDPVYMSYRGSAPDMGAYEYTRRSVITMIV